MARKPRGKKEHEDPATRAFWEGYGEVASHAILGGLLKTATVVRSRDRTYPADGLAAVTADGLICCHPSARASPGEWMHVLAHSVLHLAFGHFQKRDRQVEWQAACDFFVEKYLEDVKLGPPPWPPDSPSPGRTEEQVYRNFCELGIPQEYRRLGTAGGEPDMRPSAGRYFWGGPPDWQRLFADGIRDAVRMVVEEAAGVVHVLGEQDQRSSIAHQARAWFIGSYPLLGALAATIKLIEDRQLCAAMDIAVAAVDIEAGELHMNPAAQLDPHQARFVVAHELLHVGLRHDVRREWRDAFVWNVAFDYVINGWLVEMGVGEFPPFGLLHDVSLKGMSAEAVYDRIVSDLRACKRLCTLRGTGLGDILERTPRWWERGDGVSLDEFYRSCMAQGLAYCQADGRGFLPANLVEEINALARPPIPWDVQLAQWFDNHFPPIEKRRTYARPSRRQSSTPDIPRPRYAPFDETDPTRTFAVLLDTSGSMERTLLAKALGSIASYSASRDVPWVRLAFCDAATYDQGYVTPDDVAGRVRVRGRGGTVLQPGIDLLQRAKDFPPDGPILIITDGYCDRLVIRRDHAFLIPAGHSLPFPPKGPVFWLR